MYALNSCISNIYTSFLCFIGPIFIVDQLNEIRKATLSRVICDNGDHITHIQPESLKLPMSYVIRMTSR